MTTIDSSYRPPRVRLLESGVSRVLDGYVGMTFIVDKFSPGQSGPVAHVRDYRFARHGGGKPYQIWSLNSDQYELIIWRYKMRFEATADLCGFLNVCAAKSISLRNFESDRGDVVAFDTDITLAEIKELLAQVTDGHVMTGTVAPIADFTGEYEP